MKLITTSQGLEPRPGLALSATVGLDLPAADPSLASNWHALLPDLGRVRRRFEQDVDRLEEMENLVREGRDLPRPYLDLGRTQLMAPIILPSKIVAVGLNYRDHAEEQNKKLPVKPLLFSKATSCLQAPGLPIELPAELTQVDAEGELAVVIGKPGRAIARENARDHIAGYTCFNDVSDREAQYSDKQFFRGKSIDTGGPCGPWIVTPDELGPLDQVTLKARVNGEVWSEGSPGTMAWTWGGFVPASSRWFSCQLRSTAVASPSRSLRAIASRAIRAVPPISSSTRKCVAEFRNMPRTMS
jgi:2-keto-4-pentenoate hydratase/2-oxohepta-3-ene-1,7-dioic acid hydratase in catechol pathway